VILNPIYSIQDIRSSIKSEELPNLRRLTYSILSNFGKEVLLLPTLHL